jgi:hypothetical protein
MLNGPPVPQPQTRKSPFLHALKERGFLALLVVSAVVFASLTAFLSPLGMAALTAPFVLSTWLFLLPKASFHALQPVPLAELATPEQVRRRFLEKERAASVEGDAAHQGS